MFIHLHLQWILILFDPGTEVFILMSAMLESDRTDAIVHKAIHGNLRDRRRKALEGGYFLRRMHQLYALSEIRSEYI